ncbi:MAG TPA: LysM peptidoglycan-binding domain-containing protein [Anaerolineaceae bacterium]|nr:LysM peptidoglycan-binding domain-containing protein [Anaerolineaceae bacterium]
MERELKLTMAVPLSMKSGDSQKQEKRQQKRLTRRRILLVWSAVTFLVLGTFIIQAGRNRAPQAAVLKDLPAANLLGSYSLGSVENDIDSPEPVPEQGALAGAKNEELQTTTEKESEPDAPAETQLPPSEETPNEPETSVLPTNAELNTYSETAPVTYYAQSGDSLGVLAVRFGVDISDIQGRGDLAADQLIPEGQVLFIPNRLENTSPNQKVFPDSEIVNSPSAVGFDVETYVNNAGGFLSRYTEVLYRTGTATGAQIVEKVATEYSIHPRLLLALIEHRSGWVYGEPQSPNQKAFPLGILDVNRPGLYNQLQETAGTLGTGYYGWREGRTVVLTFKDGETLRLAAELNAGSVALMHFFARESTLAEWLEQIYGETCFANTYTRMFDDPWRIAAQYEPLITADVVQPELVLPFSEGVVWTMTVGPHAAWGVVDVRAALDFSPPKSVPGCEKSYSWVTSSSDGYVVRSENGTVVVDLDGDGNEETGWVIVYLHIATEGRVPVGTWLAQGDNIGHPSCEGGISTGSHLHIVRKYNGEWVPADGPMPFIMSGWRAVMDPISLGGWLVRGDEVVTADLYGVPSSHISR